MLNLNEILAQFVSSEITGLSNLVLKKVAGICAKRLKEDQDEYRKTWIAEIDSLPTVVEKVGYTADLIWAIPELNAQAEGGIYTVNQRFLWSLKTVIFALAILSILISLTPIKEAVFWGRDLEWYAHSILSRTSMGIVFGMYAYVVFKKDTSFTAGVISELDKAFPGIKNFPTLIYFVAIALLVYGDILNSIRMGDAVKVALFTSTALATALFAYWSEVRTKKQIEEFVYMHD